MACQPNLFQSCCQYRGGTGLAPGLGVTPGPATLLSLLVYHWFWSQDLKHCWAALGDAIHRPESFQSPGSRPKPAVHSLWLGLQLPSSDVDSGPKDSGLRLAPSSDVDSGPKYSGLRLAPSSDVDSDPKDSGLRLARFFWFSFLGWGTVFWSPFNSVHPSLSSYQALGWGVGWGPSQSLWSCSRRFSGGIRAAASGYRQGQGRFGRWDLIHFVSEAAENQRLFT